jgi:hypothetical protein
VVAQAHLVRANGLNALGDNLPRLVGPVLGGLLFGALGLPGAVLADSASFLASGLLLAAMRVPAPTPAVLATSMPPARRVGSAWGGVWRDWRNGLGAIGADRVARTLLAVEGVAIVGQGILDVLLVPFIRGVVHGDAQAFGWLLTVQAIGGLLGGVAIAQRGAALSPVRLFGLSLGANGVILAAIAHAPALPLIFALVAIAGVPVVGWLVGGQTLLQESATDRYRGRLYGAYGTTSALARLGGMGVASVAGDRLGVVPLLTVSGGLHIAAAAGVLILLRAASPPCTATDGITTRSG